jgi:hypothetical protein
LRELPILSSLDGVDDGEKQLYLLDARRRGSRRSKEYIDPGWSKESWVRIGGTG